MTTTSLPTPRTLAGSERVSSPARNTIRLALHSAGRLDVELLQRAWQVVCREAPGLAGTIRVSGDDYVFQPRPDRSGLVRRVGTLPTDFSPTAHRVLDELDSVAALEVCGGDRDHHVVSLLVRHSIADGRYGTHALERIWELYTAIAGGGSLPEPRSPRLAGPLEAMLADRAIPRGSPRESSPTAPPVYLTGRDWDGQHLSGLRHGVVRLSGEVTESLLRRCKVRSISLHGVLSAAVVTSLSRSRTDLNAFDVTSVVNVRPHVTPSIHPFDCTYALGYSISHVDTRSHASMDDIARLIVDTIRTDLRCGAAQVSSVANSELLSVGAVPTMLSNLGAVPSFAHPEDLEFTDFTIWNEMDLSSPGSPDVLAVYGNMIFASTFGGRLRVDLFHGHEMFPSGWTEVQVRQIEQVLTDYASAAGEHRGSRILAGGH